MSTWLENRRFVEKIGSDSKGLEEWTNSFIRRRMRELTFTDKVMPPTPIDPAATQVSTKNDGLVVIEEVESKSRTYVVGWRSDTPEIQYVTSPRAEIALFTIQTPKFQKFEEELWSYRHPITKVIEDNSLRDIHERKDAYFMNLSYRSAAFTGNYVISSSVFSGDSLRDGLNTIDSGRLAASTILMSKIQYNQFTSLSQTVFGSHLVADVIVNGYRYPTLKGHNLIVSIKNDQLTRNPWAPVTAATAEPAVDVASPVLAFTEDEIKPLPYDPAYILGTNLNGLKVGNTTAFGNYPASALINGRFVTGVTTAADTADGGAVNHVAVGSALAGGAYSTAGTTTSPTTAKWLGNTIMFYTRPQYLGRNYVMGDTKFSVRQIGRKIEWETWATFGIGIVNVYAVGMLIINA